MVLFAEDLCQFEGCDQPKDGFYWCIAHAEMMAE